MSESAHDLILARVARLRELRRRVEAGAEGAASGTSPATGGSDEGPTWSGGTWNN